MTTKTIRHVLKAAEVVVDDPVRLSIDPHAGAGRGGSASTPAGSSARIAQTHAEYAVIEVTCSCGRTTHIRCDYVAANPSPVRQEPAQE